MVSNWWLSALTYIEIAALAGTVLLLTHKKMLKEWRFLFVAVYFEFILKVVLQDMVIFSDGHPVRITAHHYLFYYYFYTYWFGYGLLAILRFFILGDIIRSFPGIELVPRNVYYFLVIAALTMAVSSSVYCFSRPTPIPGGAAVSLAVLLNRSVFVAWGVLAVMFLGWIKLMRLGWCPLGEHIATGAFLRILGGMIVAEMITDHDITVRLVANGLDSLFAITAFCLWLDALIKPPQTPSFGPASSPLEAAASL